MNLLLMNDLLVNTSKTELLIVSRIPTIFPSVVIDGKLIQSSESVRNLGVIIDSSLSFGRHMNAISKSANYHLRRIAHIKKYCSTRITRTLINFLVLSRIDYC